MLELIDRLEKEHILTKAELAEIISGHDPDTDEYLFDKARAVRERVYGRDVYMRGLIEFTNYCKNDCLYCGIRRSAKGAERYRLTEEQILQCCETGYGLGFRTFVLQGGEDGFYTDEKIVSVVSQIKGKFPDCAVTLSIGEKSRESYEKYRKAGADRYLLRHETADGEHYRKLHPRELSLENRMRCLYDLKELGFQTGCGFMVGSPFQTAENLAEDLLFIHKLQPQMVGIGPFIPHHDTPFAEEKAGTLETTLLMLGLTRLIVPNVLLPATTALGTVHPKGREKGILAGANVVMPNLSPRDVRDKYLLYDNKICTGDEAAECIACLGRRVESVGYKLVTAKGDFIAE
ncbi:MAG: [FeFe] hydrogenase H-cluster radical SAM maturase HydE [Muribaculaceae bacterium]|nr:[FeFe] hydrogenase H-cluster radical SAM maturase HydE [Muribaculaceae bacterium]MCM1480702.1 [FeFe] hydrogenase H-cluster radical SAM maturase HydE [Muribaculaceae bacterium]